MKESETGGGRPSPARDEKYLKQRISRKNSSMPDAKLYRTLAYLLEQSSQGQAVTRFDAERMGDHCLNSTISTLQKRLGLAISRRRTKLDGQWGPIYCKEYWLDEAQRYEARKILISSRGSPRGDTRRTVSQAKEGDARHG